MKIFRFGYVVQLGKITDQNITGKEKGAFAADLGASNEFIVTGILIRLGFDVGVMQVSRSPYDLWLFAYSRPRGIQIPLRVQIKTVSGSGSIKLGGGTRGGVDRTYKSGVKEYKYTTEHNDLIIGIDKSSLDLYLIPTQFIEDWGKSKAISHLQLLKNNWDLLLNWNKAYLAKLKSKL
jgi:hypothetical protein